jgi:hypothetical protein
MRYRLAILVLCLLAGPAWAQLASPEAVESTIQETLRPFENLGKTPFKTKWPGGQAKESYQVEQGKVSYTKFFPAGNTAITYQKSPSGAIVYEKKYGDGKDAVIIKKDERIVDYTSYWPSGQKKGKYQKNFQTKDRYYTAHNADGKQVYPKPPK